MHPARIAELLQPFIADSDGARHTCHSEERSDEESAVLSTTQLQHISTYIDLLLRWNARVNLTAIRDPEEIVTRHFGESLFAARLLFPEEARFGDRGFRDRGRAALQGRVSHTEETGALAPEAISVADLGSGAGFPGIPIKLWAPHIALTLIESNQKKTAFLREIIRALTLTHVNVFPGRAEQLLQQRSERGRHKPAESHRRPRPDQFEPLPAAQEGGQSQNPEPAGFDLVTLRAVERFASVLPVAASLLSSGGRLALLIGASQLDQAQASLPTLAWDDPFPIPQSESRILLIGHQP
jgi:16S rRNA G527 N7-methylase RsmG